MQLIRFRVILLMLLMLTLTACAGNGTDEGPSEENPPEAGRETPGDTNGGPSETSLVTQGEAAFQKSCIACHGANLEGGAGPALKGITLSKEEIVAVIKNGKGQMPGNLAPGQEEAIAEYLLSQQ